MEGFDALGQGTDSLNYCLISPIYLVALHLRSNTLTVKKRCASQILLYNNSSEASSRQPNGEFLTVLLTPVRSGSTSVAVSEK
jgi:hypothetical protein